MSENIVSEKVEIRFCDLDPYGHVNHASYFSIIETARVKAFREGFSELTADGIMLLIVRVECDYKKPITLVPYVVVDIELTSAKKTSFEMNYTIHDGSGVTYAYAKTRIACMDSKNMKLTVIPKSLHRYFAI